MIAANAFATAWPVSFERLLSILIKLRDEFARAMAQAKQKAQRLAARQSTPAPPMTPADTAVSAQSASRDCPNLCVRKNGTVPLNPPADLIEWGQKYLPDHFLKKPSAMHHWLAEQIDRAHYMRGTRLNVLGPRGGAKSTIGALALPLRAALEQREPYIWIVSDTAHQACAHLENIKTELVDNTYLAQDYPDAVGPGPTWCRNKIVLRNGVVIEAFGTGQRIRGRRSRQHRPTLIVCDDLQNDAHIRSTLQRDHSRTWFHGTLVNAGTSTTNILNLATALHRQALAMELDRTPGWRSHIFKSILHWPENMSLWAQWEHLYTDLSAPLARPTGEGQGVRAVGSSDGGCSVAVTNNPTPKPASPAVPQKAKTADVPKPSVSETAAPSVDAGGVPDTNAHEAAANDFYQQNQLAMHQGAVLLWPEVEDLYTLMRLRVQCGHTAFEREKQNSPINPDLCEWPESYFDENIWFNDWPANLIVKTMALDPSKGSDARLSDYSATVTLGMDRNGILYVEADLARRTTTDIVAQAADWFRQFQPDAFAVESNQFQDLLAGQFESEFRRQGILAARPVPIENHTPKQVCIRRLGSYLASRRFRFKANSPTTRLLVEQLQEFPLADHDDGPDALEMALRLAAQVLHGRSFNDGLGNRLPIG